MLTLDALHTEETGYGYKYEIKGKLIGPNGKTLSVCSIWINENESKFD
ncbi:MAG: hypothetical protein U9R19_01565 [Bacteroidota bacterium]|nr:hypothetical protein [Bacteroidota bacterium]